MSNIVGSYIAELTGCLSRFETQSPSLLHAASLIVDTEHICSIGVGKSGYIANKFAASLRSIGVQADYIHAAEALHGDLGRVRSKTLIVAFSKSGNSDEFKSLVPAFLNQKNKIVAITNRANSILGNAASVTIDTCVLAEGDVHDMLPLISTDMALIASNILVSLVSDILGTTKETFCQFHPGGQLGYSIGKTLESLISWKNCRPFVSGGTPILQATLAMSRHKAGIVCVIDNDGHLEGILSDGDLRALLATGRDLSSLNVSQCMNRSPKTLSPSLSIADALTYMESGDRKIFAAPVVDGFGFCLGVITIHNLLR